MTDDELPCAMDLTRHASGATRPIIRAMTDAEVERVDAYVQAHFAPTLRRIEQIARRGAEPVGYDANGSPTEEWA